MNHREQYKHLVIFLTSMVTLAFETGTFALLWYRVYMPFMENPFYLRGNWAAVALYALMMFFCTKGFNGYEIGTMRTGNAVVSNLLAIVCGNILGYLEIVLITVQYQPITLMLIVTIFEMVLVSLWMVLVRILFLKLYPPHKMIVVSSEYSPKDMLAKLNKRNDRYNICKTVSMKDGFASVTKEVLNYEAVLLYDLGAKERNDMLKFCFDHSIRTYLTPKVSDIIISGMETIYLFDSPLYLARNMGLSPMQRAIKRMADIVISLFGIIISSPIMLLVAIAIKLCDHGPVFYRQKRLTINGKSFYILKFRSMYVNSEKGVAQLAKKHDSRITPVGRVIRNLHFDELPQFFNVLAGDMSIVGPRPERPEIFKQYEESIPEFVFRLKVKAGLTGFAQVHGKYNTTPIDKLKYDMIYIQNFSLIMDLKLMLLTFKILFQKETSEGVDDCQRTAMKDVKQ